jgi:hypothetical protein
MRSFWSAFSGRCNNDMMYSLKLSTNYDPDHMAGDRWFARQIEGRFGQISHDALPLEWLLLLRDLDRETPSAASERPSS